MVVASLAAIFLLRAILFADIFIVPTYGFLSLTRNHHGIHHRLSLRASFDESIAAVGLAMDNLTVPEMQRRILQKGLEFPQTVKNEQFDRVPGCIATVYVRVTTTNDAIVQGLEGWSDAHMSRGLVAIMADCLQGLTVQEVMEYDDVPATPIESALSPGRNNGWASLFRTIQQQLRDRYQPTVVDTSVKETVKYSELPRGTLNLTTDYAEDKKKQSVALLLSGGVDSSVALHLLLNNTNYNVTAFYLKIWLEDELSHLNECPWEDDIRMCEQVCAQANVPLHIVSLQDAYRERVISHTITQAQAGRTPNPDILCNARIKMGVFWDYYCEQQQFDWMATGHYAQVDTDGRVWRAPDPVKDQSYFLCALTAAQLRRVLFPIGHLQKSQVRALAEELQLPNRQRPDSQGLCFLGKVKFDDFLSCYLGDRSGVILDALTGAVIGQHRGLHFHTVGQRKGIGKVLDPLATSRGPWYVVAKDTAANVLYCSNEYDDEAFVESRSHVALEDLHWIHNQSIPNGDYDFKIRHGARLARGYLETTQVIGGEMAEIRLEAKDSGLAPGQTIAIYNRTSGECLGCGIISEAQWARFLERREVVESSQENKN